jgi:hypothetical protein
MIQIEFSQVVFWSIEFVGAALAVLDYFDLTKKIEKFIREELDTIGEWIASNPIGQYIRDGFRTSVQYSAGILAGGFLFILLLYILDGDVGFSIIGVFLLVLAIRSHLTKQFMFGCFAAVILLVIMYSPNPDFIVALVVLLSMVLVLTVFQLFGPIILAVSFYFFLFLVHQFFKLLSRPKKGIVATFGLILAIGNPIANYIVEYLD